MDTFRPARSDFHCETARTNQFEILATLVRARYAERPSLEHLDTERLRFSLGELMRDPTIARIWIAFDGRRPIGYAIMTLGCSLRSGGRHAVVDECYLVPDSASPENYERMLATVESAADGLRLRRVFVAVADRDDDVAVAGARRGYVPDERRLLTRRLAES
jgi:hypothetical protein